MSKQDEKKDEKKEVEKADNNDVDMTYELGKIATGGREDYQQIRIAQKNRVRDVLRRKIEGIPLGKPEKKIEEEDKKYDEKYKDGNFPKLLNKLVDTGKLSDFEKKYIDKLLEISNETVVTEKRYEVLMKEYIQKEKLWYMWLEKIAGISSVFASNLLKNFGHCERIIMDKETGHVFAREIEGEKFERALKKMMLSPKDYYVSGYYQVSSLWRHTGYDPDGAKGLAGAVVGEDGKKHISYNPKLKTLIWKISDSFIKQRTPVYRKIYDDEKKRLRKLYPEPIDNPVYLETKKGFKKLYTDMHVHRMAMRKMVKIFLQHYYLISRKMKGLPVTLPYSHDKLGHKKFIEPPFNPFNDPDWNMPRSKKKTNMPESKKKTNKDE